MNLPAVIAIFAPLVIALLPLGLMDIGLIPDDADIDGTVSMVCLVGAALTSIAAAAALQRAALDYLNHGVFSAGAGFQQALRRFLPLLGLSLIIGIGTVVTIGLFVVPFLILGAIYCLTAVVFIGENRGVFASFARSAALTAGHRWRLVGIHALAALMGLGITALLMTVKAIVSLFDLLIGEVIVDMLALILATSLPLILQAVLYRALRDLPASLAPPRHNPVP